MITGRGGDDSINGFGGNDTITGGVGLEYQYGGTGDDTFILYAGDSQYAGSGNGDFIYEWSSEGNDKIILANTLQADVRMWTDTNGHLYIQYSATDRVYVRGAENAAGESLVGSMMETIQFSDSSTWTLANGLILTDTDDGHSIYGSGAVDTIDGRGGNDTIYGYGGNDTLRGGDGVDSIYGGDGNDWLYGGAGVDTLRGDAGADSYVFEAATAYSAVDTVGTFSLAESDKINLVNLLGEYDPLTEAITDFVQITTSGSNSSLFVDRDGTGGTYGMNQIATIQGVTGLTDEAALVTAGNLVVV